MTNKELLKEVIQDCLEKRDYFDELCIGEAFSFNNGAAFACNMLARHFEKELDKLK